MNDRFDALAKELGEPQDRRGMIKAAAGGTLGLLGFAALADEVLGKKCKKKKDCPKGKKCKNKENGKGRCK
jgi:hypothetical protein